MHSHSHSLTPKCHHTLPASSLTWCRTTTKSPVLRELVFSLMLSLYVLSHTPSHSCHPCMFSHTLTHSKPCAPNSPQISPNSLPTPPHTLSPTPSPSPHHSQSFSPHHVSHHIIITHHLNFYNYPHQSLLHALLHHPHSSIPLHDHFPINWYTHNDKSRTPHHLPTPQPIQSRRWDKPQGLAGQSQLIPSQYPLHTKSSTKDC